MFVYICIHRIYSFYIYIKGMSGHVTEQLKLCIFLKSSLFVAFLWTHFKIRKKSLSNSEIPGGLFFSHFLNTFILVLAFFPNKQKKTPTHSGSCVSSETAALSTGNQPPSYDFFYLTHNTRGSSPVLVEPAFLCGSGIAGKGVNKLEGKHELDRKSVV